MIALERRRRVYILQQITDMTLLAALLHRARK